MKKEIILPIFALLHVFLLTVSTAGASELSELKLKYKRPLEIPFPKSSPYSPQVATLGKMLFFDPRLSGAQNMTCASCHNPSFGYEVPVETAVGAANTPLGRQAPTVLNSAWVKPLFWDGRAETLEDQAEGPIIADVEMNAKFEDILKRLGEVLEYRAWFDQLFPEDGLTKDNILRAIATYERTVVSGWSPFDRWVDGNESAISASAKRGFEVFNNEGNCADCHIGWNFTDNEFHDIGMPSEDIGRAALEPDNPKAKHAFKTPGLRDLAHRAPFMHNGTLPDIRTVVSFYETGGVERPSRSNLIKPLNLSDQQREDLIEFLNTLTAENTDINMPILPN